MRREVPVSILFLTGLLMIAARYLDVPAVGNAASAVQEWGVILSGFALGTAAINLVVVHGRNVRSGKNVLYSVTLVVALVVMALVGIFLGTSAKPFLFLYDSLMSPMTATMFAMLAFYVASAAYRAFVVRNLDAAVLLITGVIMMLNQVGIGELIHPQFANVASWVLDVPNLAGQRGLMIGTAVGAIAISLRVLVGIDRTHFGGGE